MKRIPDPELLLRGFYADELRAAAPGLRPAEGGSSVRAPSPLRAILAAAASLAIIAGSAIAERPAGLEARGIPIMAAAFAELADSGGLLEPFKAWAEELKERGGS
jgi:hypothetical protein